MASSLVLRKRYQFVTFIISKFILTTVIISFHLLCNIICSFFYSVMVWAGRVGRTFSTEQWNSVALQIFAQQVLLWKWFHNCWKDAPEQSGSSLCLRFSHGAFCPLITYPVFGFIAFPFDPRRWSSWPPSHQNLFQEVTDFPHSNTNSCPCRKSLNLLTNPCIPSITSISQHLCSRRNPHYHKLCRCKCFWWGLRHIICWSSSSKPKARNFFAERT
jgi:hypothetical protein